VEKDYGFYYTLAKEQYEEELKLWYREKTGEVLDLENPQTFNEKIQWLKLYDSTPMKTLLADKLLVRDWVAEKIGEEYLIPLLHVYESFDDVNFDELPAQFALKPNHGSGYHCIVSDRSDFDPAKDRKKFERWMREDFAFKSGLELHYHGIQRRIVAEEYVHNHGKELYDYKVFCFEGKAESILFIYHRQGKLAVEFYDLKWNRLPFGFEDFLSEEGVAQKPDNLQQLIDLAEKLAEGFHFVRVDFYRLNDGQYKFSEMTFTPGSGVRKWSSEEIDRYYGSLIRLGEKKEAEARRPAVSVLLSGYESPESLEKTLKALREQTLSVIEILCADDGTDSRITKTIREYAQMDSRIHAAEGQGEDAAGIRRMLLEAAQGEYVMFMNDACEIKRDTLMVLCRRISGQRADLALCGGRHIYLEADGKTDGYALLSTKAEAQGAVFSGKTICPASLGAAALSIYTMMFRRTFLDRCAPPFRGERKEEDCCYAIDTLKACERVTAVCGDWIIRREEQRASDGFLLDALQMLHGRDEAQKPFARRMAWELCLNELKKASGIRYTELYRLLKQQGLKTLGLLQAEKDGEENDVMRRQIEAMIESDTVIQFE